MMTLFLTLRIIFSALESKLKSLHSTSLWFLFYVKLGILEYETCV